MPKYHIALWVEVMASTQSAAELWADEHLQVDYDEDDESYYPFDRGTAMEASRFHELHPPFEVSND